MTASEAGKQSASFFGKSIDWFLYEMQHSAANHLTGFSYNRNIDLK